MKHKTSRLHIGQDDYMTAIRRADRELDLQVRRKGAAMLHRSRKTYTRKTKHKCTPEAE